MKIKKLFTIILLLFISLSLCSQTKIVVIDAGHGGKDPGAQGRIADEKDITLAIALKVGEYLEKNMTNVKVIYTRKTDVFVPLDKRAEIANKNNADLFVSIHVNAIRNSRLSGCETYVMGLHKSEDNLNVAVAENSVILMEKDYKDKYDNFDPKSPEAYIILNLYQNEYLNMSLDLANKIQHQFKERARRNDLGVKQAGFLVLWQTTMPSVLIETGFISNRNEEVFLSSEYGQEIIASAIFRAIRDYLNEN